MTMASGQEDDETLAGTSSEEPLSLSTPGPAKFGLTCKS